MIFNRLECERPRKMDRYAQDVADWCQRSLDDARKNGRLETRPFVQNVELIIAALRAYNGLDPTNTARSIPANGGK